MSTEKFQISVLLSLTTGVLVSGFDDMHHAFEHILGRPVWTHELAQQGLWETARAMVFAQHPVLADINADALSASCADKNQDEKAAMCAAWLEDQIRTIGASELDVVGAAPKSDDEIADALAQSISNLRETRGESS